MKGIALLIYVILFISVFSLAWWFGFRQDSPPEQDLVSNSTSADSEVKDNKAGINKCQTGNSECTSNLAQDIGDANLCNNANGTYKQASCLTSVAITNRDVTICERIKETSLRMTCYGLVANATLDFKLCDKIKGTFEFAGVTGSYQNVQNECYLLVAESVKDSSVCESVRSEVQGWCYAGSARGLKDTQLCNYIEAGLSRDGCIVGVARAANEPNVCEQLSASTKDHCYTVIAEIRKDTAYCDKLSSDKDICLYTVAEVADDQAICGQITDSSIKSSCELNAGMRIIS